MKHQSKAKAYVQEIGKKVEDLPAKFKENFEAMEDFEDIMYALQPDVPEYKEALAEWKDYDEQILVALQRDFPKKKPAPKAAKEPASDAKKPATKPEIKEETSTATLTWATRADATAFAKAWAAHTLRGHSMTSGMENVEVKLTDVTNEEKKWVNDYIKEHEEKQASKKKSKSKPAAYSWKKAVPVSGLKPVVLHCQHYHLAVKEPTYVSLKGTGNASRKVKAKPGEHIIFDDKGHPVFIMNASSFARKCTEQSTVEKHKEDNHKPASKPNASTRKPASKPKPKTSKTAQSPSKSDDKKPAAAKSTSAIKPAAKKKETAPKKKTESKPKSKPASSRRSPVEVIEQEIKDIRKTQKKDMSADDRQQFKKEYADLEEKASNKSYIGYIRSQLQAAEKDGVKLSEAQVKKLGQMIQPMIQNTTGAFLDMLTSNKKRLKPTYENLLRWTESPDRYDLIGVDTARTDETVTARKPKKPGIFELIGL